MCDVLFDMRPALVDGLHHVGAVLLYETHWVCLLGGYRVVDCRGSTHSLVKVWLNFSSTLSFRPVSQLTFLVLISASVFLSMELCTSS